MSKNSKAYRAAAEKIIAGTARSMGITVDG